jgi:ribosomal protein S18 acetylase RimI-like enzyme
MPRLSNMQEVRRILQSDPVWSIYALGDLEPAFVKDCSWFWPSDEAPALALLYRGFSPPIFFALGEPDSLEPLLDEIAEQPELSLQVRPEILPLLASRYRLSEERSMWRMALQLERFRPAAESEIFRLSGEHVNEVRALYGEGEAAGESPEFFAPASLDTGVFYGAWAAGELAAVAGTHLVSASEGVAAIGNIFTRPDQRGRGLAAQVTSAVVTEVLRQDIATIALNVKQNNEGAIRVYERLGFQIYCEFREAVAMRADVPH